MAQTIQLRRGTSAEWSAADPVLAQGEPGWVVDAKALKIGDGVSAFSELDSALDAGAEQIAATDDEITTGTETATRKVSPAQLRLAAETHGGDIVVSALPASPTAYTIYRLTAADDTAKAAPGRYLHDGAGWCCLDYFSVYALGNLGATPSLTLIAGARYSAVQNEAITSFAVEISRPGLVEILKTGAYAIAEITMTDRTRKRLTAWTPAASAFALITLEDDGTYLLVAAAQEVA